MITFMMDDPDTYHAALDELMAESMGARREHVRVPPCLRSMARQLRACLSSYLQPPRSRSMRDRDGAPVLR
jgi:hypothetical protein